MHISKLKNWDDYTKVRIRINGLKTNQKHHYCSLEGGFTRKLWSSKINGYKNKFILFTC